MTTLEQLINVIQIDTGPPGPHTGRKILRVANVEGGSGNYTVTWRPICDLSEAERQKISCALDYRDAHPTDSECNVAPPCSQFNDTVTCCRSGNCGGDGVFTRYRTGETDRELIVTIDNIAQFAQNFGSACQMIFHWTLVDNVTGDVFDGCCGVVFQWRVITPPPLDVNVANCNQTIQIDTSLDIPTVTNISEITTVAGGVGPYAVSWQVIGSGSGCVGTFTDEVVTNDDGIATGFATRVDNIPRFTQNANGQPCVRTVRWTVQDLGILNEFGNPIGRVETGTCTSTYNYTIVTPPSLDVTTVGCNDTIDIATGTSGVHSGTKNLQIGEISGGSGNYTVEWSTVPTITTGECAGNIVASIHPTNPRILVVQAVDIPQFFDNKDAPCTRGYTARVIDNVTGLVEEVQCQVSFRAQPNNAAALTITAGGCGSITAVDTGSCSTDRIGRRTSIVTGITGGSGDYSITWVLPPAPQCSIGTFQRTTSNDGGQGDRNLNVEFTPDIGAVGECTYPAVISVRDNVTLTVTELPCNMTFRAEALSQCPPLAAMTAGCDQTIAYYNHPEATGNTATATLNVSATGGSGQYGILWDTTPVSVTGQCHTQQVSQTATGSASRNLTVSLTGIPTSASGTCVRTYRYTITDLVTSETISGTCQVTFLIQQATQLCAITYGARTCSQSGVTLNTTTAETRTFEITGLEGAFGSGYEIEWRLSSSCGGIAKFSNGGTVITTTTTSTSASIPVTFQAPLNSTGSCSVNVSAKIKSVEAGSTRDYCGSPISCTYNATWNTQTAPTATVNCPTGSVVLTRDASSQTRTYSLSNVVNATSVSWQVAGCQNITVTPRSTTGTSITVTYAAPATGAGAEGECDITVVATLSGPGGSTQYTCNDTVDYNTRPAPIEITSITNCGQSQSISATVNPRRASFNAMRINHSAGAGGPYTYEWIRVNQTGACSSIGWTPITSSSDTISPVADIGTTDAGSCVVEYQARVRDVTGTWSAPFTCSLTVNYAKVSLRAWLTALSASTVNTFERIGGYRQLSVYPGSTISVPPSCAQVINTAYVGVPTNQNPVVPTQLSANGTPQSDGRLGFTFVHAADGVPPYTTTLTNLRVTSGSLPASECINFLQEVNGTPSGYTAAAQFTSATQSPSGDIATLTAHPQGDVIATIGVIGRRGNTPYDVRGMLDIKVTDATGTSSLISNVPFILRKIS